MALNQKTLDLFSNIFGYTPNVGMETTTPTTPTTPQPSGTTMPQPTTQPIPEPQKTAPAKSPFELKKELFANVFGYMPDVSEPEAIPEPQPAKMATPELPPEKPIEAALSIPVQPEGGKELPAALPTEMKSPEEKPAETKLPDKIPLMQLNANPEIAAIESRFLSVQDPRAKALELKSLPQDKGIELMGKLPEEDKKAVESELQNLLTEDRKANAFAVGLLQSTPVPAFLPKEGKEELAETAKAAPLQTAAGQIVGTFAQAALGAGALNNLLTKTPMGKSSLLKSAITRVGVSGGIAAEQNIGRKDFKEAIGDVVQQSGGGLISLVPEILAPPGIAQLVYQPLSDLIYDAASGVIRGQDVGSKDWWKNEVITLAASAGLAARDAVSGKTFKLEQQAQKDDLIKLINSGKAKKIELVQPKGKEVTNALSDEKSKETVLTKPIEQLEQETKNIVPKNELSSDVMINEQPPEAIQKIELPKRQVGFASERGAIGEEPQVRLEYGDSPEEQLAKAAQEKFDAQRETVRKKFAKSFKQKLEDAKDFIGTTTIDQEYIAKKLLSRYEDGDQVIGKMNAAKGSTSEAQVQYDAGSKAVSEYLPHNLEELFADYLQAKRVVEIEKNKEPGTIKHAMGMTGDEARAIVDKIENGKGIDAKKAEAIKVSSGRYWDVMKDQLTQLKDNGLLKEEAFNSLVEQGVNYSPREFIQHIDPDKISTFGNKVSVSDSGIKRLDEGSEEAMVNNWRLLMSDVIARTQSRIYKNKATSELYNFVKNNPNNDIDLKEEMPLSRKISVDDARDIATNLQGAQLKINQRLKTPITVEQRLSLEKKISDLEEQIDDLTIDRKMSETGTDAEISELQKRALDLDNILRKSENDTQYQYNANKIKAINEKIGRLSKYPITQEITNKIKAMEKTKQLLTDKMNEPLTGTDIQNLQNRYNSLTEKINRWGDLIKKADEEGTDEITLESKQYGKLPAGYERISSMIDGEKKSVIAPTKFVQAWDSSDKPLNKAVAHALNILSLSFITKPFATGTFAPEFALTNIVRDMAMQWLTTKEYSTVAPVALYQAARNLGAVVKDAWNGDGRWRDYVKHGGGMESFTEQGALLRDPSKPYTVTTERNKQILKTVSKFQEFSERLGRLALREQALKNGKSAEDATRIAREYLDFAQGGSWVKAANNAVPYLNASVQGTRAMARAFKQDKSAFAAKALQLMAMGAGLAYTAYTVDPKTTEQIPDREKVSRWNFPLPQKIKGRFGETISNYFSIPKDQSSRIFATIGEVITERAMGKISGKKAWRKIGMAFSDINPIDVIGFIPPSMSMIVGYSLNKNFWMNDDIWKGQKVHPHAEYYSGTSKALVDVANELSKIGIEISPARMEASAGQVLPRNPITSFMGGTYRQLTDGIPEDEKEKLDKTTMDYLTSLPGTRKFFRKAYPLRIDEDELKKGIRKYHIKTHDAKGNRRPITILQEEFEENEMRENDIKSENNTRLNIASQLLLSGNKGLGQKKLRELKIQARKSLGAEEVERINERLDRIKSRQE